MPRQSFRGRELLLIAAASLFGVAILFVSRNLRDGLGLECRDYANLAWQGSPIHTRIERDLSTHLFATRPAQWFSSFTTECQGILLLTSSGTFTFALNSRHFAEFWLDDTRIVHTPGGRFTRSSAGVPLEAGEHRVRFRMAHPHRGDEPELLMAHGGAPLRPLNPNRVSRHPKPQIGWALVAPARAAPVAAPLLVIAFVAYRTRAALRRWAHWVSSPLVRGHEAISVSRVRSLVVILGVAIAVRVALSVVTHPILWPDSEQYYDTALAHLRGDVFSHNLLSTPLFPAFMALFLSSGATPAAGAAMIAAQRLLAVGATVLVYRLGREAFDRETALYAVLIWTVSTVQLYYESVVSTEALFVVILVGVVAAAVRWLKHPSVTCAAVVGLLCVVATLTRPIAKAMALIVLAVAWWRPPAPRARLLLSSLVLLGTFSVGVLPWMYVNRQTYGFWGVSRGEGLWLFLRAIDIDGLVPPATTAYPVVREVFDALRPTHHFLHYAVYEDLHSARGYSARQADDAMLGFALETVIAHPVRFVMGTGKQAAWLLLAPYRSVQICAAEDGPYLCAERSQEMRFPAFPNRPVAGRTPLKTMVAAYMRAAYWIIPLLAPLAVVGMVRAVRGRSSAAQLLLVGVAAYFITATALFNTVQDRYRLPIDAFLVMFAIHELRHHLGRLPSDSPRHE